MGKTLALIGKRVRLAELQLEEEGVVVQRLAELAQLAWVEVLLVLAQRLEEMVQQLGPLQAPGEDLQSQALLVQGQQQVEEEQPVGLWLEEELLVERELLAGQVLRVERALLAGQELRVERALQAGQELRVDRALQVELWPADWEEVRPLVELEWQVQVAVRLVLVQRLVEGVQQRVGLEPQVQEEALQAVVLHQVKMVRP